MKILEHYKEDVTDKLSLLLPHLKPLHLKVELNKVVQIPETENERKIFAIYASLGHNESKREYYSVTDMMVSEMTQGLTSKPIGQKVNSVTDNIVQKSDKVKEHIKAIWKIINTPVLNSGICSICGKKNEDLGYGKVYYDCRRKTCYNQECKTIYQLLKWFFAKKINQIEKAERRFVCSYCKKEYHSPRKDSKFCSVKCRVANHRVNEV
jgi:hypothetical protein